MSLLIKPKETAPATSLQEKTNGFKFKVPTANGKPETTTAPIVEEPVIAKPVAPDANRLLIGGQVKPKIPVAANVQKSATAIPEMADGKYEVVAGSSPEFSEEAGDKFQQQLAMLQNAIDGDGVLKDQMVNILTFLDDNPEYKENIGPKDVAVFVAGCRKVAGITVTEKVQRKTRTTKTTADVQEVLDDLADLSFDL